MKKIRLISELSTKVFLEVTIDDGPFSESTSTRTFLMSGTEIAAVAVISENQFAYFDTTR